VSVEASEMVTVPRAELDALKAELRRLRREVGRAVARARIETDPGPGDDALTLSRSQLAEAWGISGGNRTRMTSLEDRFPGVAAGLRE
jgi:hypothetical protein